MDSQLIPTTRHTTHNSSSQQKEKITRTLWRRTIFWHDLGRVPYPEAGVFQEMIKKDVKDGKMNACLIFFDTPPVFTLGKRSDLSDFKIPFDEIPKTGIEVFYTNRGGKVTYHGPGQLVGYMIVNLNRIGLKVPEFVGLIEDVLSDLLSLFGIIPSRKKDYPGLWVGDKKIASVGLHIEKGVTSHGWSLNIDPDLSHYDYIHPCGIKGAGITSIKAETKTDVSRSEIRDGIIKGFDYRIFAASSSDGS